MYLLNITKEFHQLGIEDSNALRTFFFSNHHQGNSRYKSLKQKKIWGIESVKQWPVWLTFKKTGTEIRKKKQQILVCTFKEFIFYKAKAHRGVLTCSKLLSNKVTLNWTIEELFFWSVLQYFYLKNDTNMLEAVVLHDKILLIFKQQIRFSYKLILDYS